jgi:hypothetical protein
MSNYPDPNEMSYDVWKATVRRDIKRALRRSPGLVRHTPEHIARILGMNEHEIFYARALAIDVRVYSMLTIDEARIQRWLDDAPVINPWWEILERQEEEGWWSGQMRLPLWDL